jgi:hypothetical protein
MNKEKSNKIYNLMDSIEHDKEKISKFISWFHPKLSWYIEKNIEYSESQLDEIIEFLKTLKGENI